MEVLYRPNDKVAYLDGAKFLIKEGIINTCDYKETLSERGRAITDISYSIWYGNGKSGLTTGVPQRMVFSTKGELIASLMGESND